MTRLPFGEAAPAPPRARPGRKVLTVAELTARIRLQLESAYPTVWVEGELSNCRRWNTGHLYFSLKGGTAQIRGVMFRSAFRYLRFEPCDGLRVVARAGPGGPLEASAEGRTATSADGRGPWSWLTFGVVVMLGSIVMGGSVWAALQMRRDRRDGSGPRSVAPRGE